MERHWEDSAASLTTGMILHACYTAAAEDRVASLADLAGHFTRPGVEFRETLNEMVSYPHDTEYRRGWRTPAGTSMPSRAVASFLFCAAAILAPPLLLEGGVGLAAPSCPPSLGDPHAVTRAEGAACGAAA